MYIPLLIVSALAMYYFALRSTEKEFTNNNHPVPEKELAHRKHIGIVLLIVSVACAGFYGVKIYNHLRADYVFDTCPAAYYRGYTTPDELSEFYGDRLNFCAVCDRCRYSDDDGHEIDGQTFSSDNVFVWVCGWCLKDVPLYISVDGVYFCIDSVPPSSD